MIVDCAGLSSWGIVNIRFLLQHLGMLIITLSLSLSFVYEDEWMKVICVVLCNSPSGKLVQIEHALTAVGSGQTSLGIKGQIGSASDPFIPHSSCCFVCFVFI